MTEEKTDEISSAIEFLQKIAEEDVVSIKFTKKDGSPRLMKCTLNFERIPKEYRPKGVKLKDILHNIKKNKLLHVFDLEKLGWRSVPFERTDWLKTKTTMYSIKKMEDLFKK